ncbi:MAG: hypothetical protein H5T83_04145, partial [Actinotalea sp.]|nr:hypothetical protein [Actinotalea sp.]
MARIRIRALLAGTGTLALVLAGAPAQAAPPPVERIVEEWDDTVIDTCGDDTEDPADDIMITSRFVGRFEITLHQRAPGAPLVFTGRGHEV